MKGVVLCPLPRYATGFCCEKPGHLTNLRNADLPKVLLELADMASEKIRRLLASKGLLQIKIANVAKTLLGAGGDNYQHWGEDPLFPKTSGYVAVLNRLVNDYKSSRNAAKRKASADWDSSSNKRQPWSGRGGRGSCPPTNNRGNPRFCYQRPRGHQAGNPWRGGHGGYGGRRGRPEFGNRR